MTCRVITDPSGRQWNVWAVQPQLFAAEHGHRRALVAEELAAGWLAFELTDAQSEKRRLAPVPGDWEAMPEPALLELWRRATPVAARAHLRLADDP